MSSGDDISRLRTNDIEIGISEALQKHISRHVVAAKPVSQRKLNFERQRPRWLREMVAEAVGVFFYVFPGIGAVANFTINKQDAGFGSLLQVGFAFALGIAFAIMTCAPVSGGHFNPAVTICLAIWQGFPWKKVPRYIFSQIIGSIIAGALMMGLYHQQFAALDIPDIGPGSKASALCSFPLPGQSLGYLFMIEWFVDSYIGIIIWTCLDPANPFVTPALVPFAIGLGYAAMIWAYADITISTNLARDLGTRIVAAIWYGGGAFTYAHYSWISILVNVPATIFATGFYELLMRDSLQKIGKGHAVHADGDDALALHLTKTGIPTSRRGDVEYLERGYTNAVDGKRAD